MAVPFSMVAKKVLSYLHLYDVMYISPPQATLTACGFSYYNKRCLCNDSYQTRDDFHARIYATDQRYLPLRHALP